ncbi:MAG: M28 family peptidase [Pseudomonadota bacterium]|nr:M28 family peptidase [Pseudomonadota bacterium]
MNSIKFRLRHGAILFTALLTLLSFKVLSGGHQSLEPRGPVSDAWFGVAMPDKTEDRSNRLRKALVEPDLPQHSIRLPASEDPYRDIKGDELMAYLQEVINITRETRPEGENFWGRIGGSRSEIAVAEYMAKKFKDFGLNDVQLDDVPGGEQWWPLNWSATLIGDEAYGKGTKDVNFKSAFPAIQLGGIANSTENLEAELVYVGQGHVADLLGRDVKGKIAVMLANLQPDGFFQTARGHAENAVEAGAAGVLIVMEAPGNHQYALEDMGPPEVPSLVLGGDDGRFLISAIEAAGEDHTISARLSLTTEIRPNWNGKNVRGTIIGETDEWVVIVSHLDGYFDSANDNGAGLASLMALARFYAERDIKPRRNMMFVGTSAHHEYSDGADAFIRDHADILKKTVGVMNIEHPASIMSYYRGELKFKNFTLPGQLNTTTTHGSRSLNISNQSELLTGFYREGIDRYGLVVDAMLERSPPTGDAIAFFRAGNTVMQILDSNIWYHSDGDMIDTIPGVGVARATRVYAYVLDQIEKHSRKELLKKG